MREWARRILGYDTETTGTGKDARILEFGAVLQEDCKVVTSYQVFLQPDGVDWDSPSVREAMAVNKIEWADIERAKTFAQEFDYIKHALMQSDVRVGHNVLFDSRMLKQEFRRAIAAGTLSKDVLKGAQHIVTLDTLALDFALIPDAKGHKLEQVAARWGVSNWQKHRAIGDADASIRILSNMSDHLPSSLDETVAICKASQVRWEAKWSKRNDDDLSEEKKQLLLEGPTNG